MTRELVLTPDRHCATDDGRRTMAPTHREKTTTVTARDVAVITERIARDGDGDEVLHVVWKNDDWKASNAQDWCMMFLFVPVLAIGAVAVFPWTCSVYYKRKREFRRERYAVSNKRFFYWKANATEDVWSCALKKVNVGWQDDFGGCPCDFDKCAFGGEMMKFEIRGRGASRVATVTMMDEVSERKKYYLRTMNDNHDKLYSLIEQAQTNAEKKTDSGNDDDDQ